ncbi:MAG: aminotransferase class I/II-fold pyridoxal phosphate-dependent enzyme [Clostridiales bacterium]|nr:aminotransferase class I/II-fold pyridoxal phosphate-dependent enzyme [Clostridiales bacterium]
MQAVILAAGMGKRLKELTKNNTKCMVEVNGVPLIYRLLYQLEKYKLERVVMVVGYEAEKLIDYVKGLSLSTPLVFINNPVYDKTNNIYSLSLAKDYLCKDDTLLFESDLIVEDGVIDLLLNDERDTLALVDKYESWMDGTCVKLSDNDDIIEFVPGKKFKFEDIKSYYKTVNIYKFGKHFSKTHYVPFLEAYCNAVGNNEYYEQVLKIITMLDDPEIKAKRLNGQLWYEIDDIQDLDIASSMFADDGKKLKAIQGRYGGYWRYPKLLDFCYLVNPYFPPQKLLDEIKANFDILATQYPSGMRVNSLLAAKNFGVRVENIAVGNGAAELIKSLMSRMNGRVGVIRPTFEEYPNRYDADKQVVYYPDNKDFSYTADDLIRYYSGKNIDCLILINPDNPTGNFIKKDGLSKILSWTTDNKVSLILDESFVDFADGEDNSLIEQGLIEKYTNLCIVKSISKSYGVPGLRLGIAVSGDTELIDYLKKDVGIWNINSFAEFYLQIEEKYRKDYVSALVKFKEVRKEFIRGLKSFKKYLRVIPTQANYVTVELIGGLNATVFTQELYLKHNILIKDLSSKTQGKAQYVRIAVRNTEDNDKLIKALSTLLRKET